MPSRSVFPFRSDIEGLRAIAVLAVVGFHYGIARIAGGFVGVDVFFVISGYLITGLLLSELASSDRIDFVRFYGRRARRLLPAALTVCIATLVAAPLIISPLELKAVARASVASSLYLSNYLFLHQSFGYFSPESASNPFLHTWSLSVEEQFYLVWPAFLLLVGRSGRKYTLVFAILALTGTSFAACVWLTNGRQPWAFFSLPTRGWEFGFGGIAALVPMTSGVLSSFASCAIGWVGMLLLVVSSLLTYDLSRFPGPDAALAASATVLVLLSGARGGRSGPRLLLGTLPFQWIGKLSYSIYLWHWPIVVYWTVVSPPSSPWDRLAIFCVTLLCATASYHLVEQPIRNNRWLGQRAIRSLKLGASLTLAGLFIALGAMAVAGRLASARAQRLIEEASLRKPTASGTDETCLVPFLVSTPVACVFGSANPTRTIVLFGDSHADQWSTPIILLALRNGWRVVTYMKSACAAADIPVYNRRLHRFSPECTAWRDNAVTEIIRLRPNFVVIAEFSSGYIRGPLTTDLGENSVDVNAWADGLMRTMRKFQLNMIPAIVLRDSPTPGRDIRICLSRAEWHRLPASVCDSNRSAAIDETVTDAERKVTSTVAGAHFVDLTPQFCNTRTCWSVREGTVVYKDWNHLTSAYAEQLAEPLSLMLAPII